MLRCILLSLCNDNDNDDNDNDDNDNDDNDNDDNDIDDNDIIDTNSNNDDNTFVKTVAVGWTFEQHQQPMLNINGKY